MTFTTDNAVIGRNIRKFRESRGLTITELAKKIGRERHAVSRWERGKGRMMMGDFGRMAEVTGISPDELNDIFTEGTSL